MFFGIPFTEEELINAELDAKKNSVVMHKVKENIVVNRILVPKDSIEDFKKMNYLLLEKDIQIGEKINE